LEKALTSYATGGGDVPGGFGAQPRTKSYRPDIDGLRAVAVVPVVLFHSGVSLFSGGFVGVDVFFVISGYLITQILYREAKEGRFSIARFYARRIRRIFPALFFALAGTIAAGLWILLPDELSALARSAIATAIFCSNLLFWNETGYFATEAIYKPLLHTWSLAVEELFYIFFPLGLWLMHRFRERSLGTSVCQHNPFTVQNGTVLHWLNSAGADAIIWPGQALCRGSDCATFVNGQPASWDRDHLTPTAAKFVLDRSGFIRPVRR
jgi:peptidoglycan/LPS O-acetylase OafA/YrhL